VLIISAINTTATTIFPILLIVPHSPVLSILPHADLRPSEDKSRIFLIIES